jgi:thiopeptide-type bacteriocin biosynthesis protein
VPALTPPGELAESVLAILAGAALDEAAGRAGLQAEVLADAIEAYKAAGYAALQAQAAREGWFQAHVQFAEWHAAEHAAATSLAPRLTALHDQGAVAAWWFIRKAPCWRLRVQAGPASSDITPVVGSVLDSLMAAGLVERWRESIYEPEATAFGGLAGMDIAHALFHADSDGILRYAPRLAPAAPAEPGLGRRELSVLLCSALLRSAAQDWHEQGDVWHRVTRLRPLPPGTPVSRLQEMSGSLRRLMTADTRPEGALFGPDAPLAFAGPWAAAFAAAGQALSAEAGNGTLERGLRDILAHHVIFHWNRLGLPDRTQSILARAARDAVMDPPEPEPGDLTGGR